MLDSRDSAIIEYLKNHPESSSREIFDHISIPDSYATVKRVISKLISDQLITSKGLGKGTKYLLSPGFLLFEPVDLEKYFEKEVDERKILQGFNFQLLTVILPGHELFTADELEKLSELHQRYQQNISELSESEYKNELERLAIDLSWKSAQIEGNTYSLLETEQLLREKETVSGKTKEEAIMLLNHKDAIDFIVEHPDYLNPISVSKIEDIHRILVKELAIDKNIRKRRIGISGTNYRPLDNQFQIKEALNQMCQMVNNKVNVFEKALLLLVLLSYIQPFMDGNKRTARIVSNAMLMNHQYCPLSFRTVDSIEYKKAMLLFYEQNNLSSFKQIFIDQFEFAVDTYF